jgi:hypothetical protein
MPLRRAELPHLLRGVAACPSPKRFIYVKVFNVSLKNYKGVIMARARKVLPQTRQINFEQLFAGRDWASSLRGHISSPDGLKQFEAFVRSKAFMDAMRLASLTPEGRKNIVAALQDKDLRGAMLKNFDSHTVRWAIGDLFNSPQGKLIMGELLFSKGLPSFSSLAAVRDIVRAMVTTKLEKKEIMRDFNHFKIPEQTIKAKPEDTAWFKKAMSSDANTKSFLSEIRSGEGIVRMMNFLRTQKAREVFDDVLSTPEGRKRVARLLTSLQGQVILKMAMKTPEGMNMVGFLWNMQNGKDMIKGQMLNPAGLRTIHLIIGFQQEFNQEQQRRQNILGTKLQRGR